MQLANAGADLNVLDSEGDTPLHFACFEGNVPAVETLLNFEQTDCTIRNKRGKTPMDLARNEGEEKIVQMMQRHLQKLSMSGQDIESEQPPPPVPPQLSLAEIRSTMQVRVVLVVHQLRPGGSHWQQPLLKVILTLF